MTLTQIFGVAQGRSIARVSPQKGCGGLEPWEAVIIGEPASKANSRRLVQINGKPRFIKSQKALDYEKTFQKQIPQFCPKLPVEDLLRVDVTIFYRSRRPDLDPSLIFDLLQKCEVIRNDRQIREIHAFWNLDRNNPRAHIRLTGLPKNYGQPL